MRTAHVTFRAPVFARNRSAHLSASVWVAVAFGIPMIIRSTLLLRFVEVEPILPGCGTAAGDALASIS